MQQSLGAAAKSPYPQRDDARAAGYRWDSPDRFHYIVNPICPHMLYKILDRLQEEAQQGSMITSVCLPTTDLGMLAVLLQCQINKKT